jgi:uncharacterized protein
MIFETIITTVNLAGEPHISPFGIQYEGDLVLIAPYKPSTTLENILATKTATLNITDDVRIFAGAISNNYSNINLSPLQPNIHAGCRLANALTHSELRLIDVKDDDVRPTLRMQKVTTEMHAPFLGFNRAQAAVVELSILVSRLHLLPREKIMVEMQYLQIAIDKTAGEHEKQAWSWLAGKINAFYADQKLWPSY